jgi:hypothetical protein
MIGINGFDAHARVAAVLRANQVSAPEPVPSSSEKPAAGAAVPLNLGQSSRSASASGPSIFAVDLSTVGRNRTDIGDALSGSLKDLLEVFQGRGKAGEAVETALATAAELIGVAADDSAVSGFQLRVASVVRSFGAEGDGKAAYGSVTGFAIEIGLVRGGRVNAEDVRLLGFSGDDIGLSAEQRRTGIADGVYRVLDKAPAEVKSAIPRGQNKAQLEALKNALDRLALVQDALSAYRRGDARALEEVEKFFRSGTLDAGAVRALSDVRGTSQTVVPGSGIVSLS